MSESGVDNGQLGSYEACAGGAFNKIIEGMAKIHKLCEVNFITPATAALQLPCIVRQVLKTYLVKNPDALEQVENEGLSAIWSELQPQVLDIMQCNFSAIYPSVSGHTNPNLLALVEAGEYTDLSQDSHLLKQQAPKNSVRQQVGESLIIMC